MGEKERKKGQKRGKIRKFSCLNRRQLWMLSCRWATAQLPQRLLSAQAVEAAVPLQLKNSGYTTASPSLVRGDGRGAKVHVHIRSRNSIQPSVLKFRQV